MRSCRDCRFPRRLARFLEWHSDGTVIGSVRPRIPIMFLETAEWETVFRELSSNIGVPIDHIIINAQKNVGKEIYDMATAVYVVNVKRIPNKRFFRPQWLAKLLVRVMREDLAALGAGRATVLEYVTGKSLTLRFSDPCMIPLTVGNCLGIYESTEEMPGSSVEYALEDGSLVVRMQHAGERPESEERLYLEEVEPGEGPFSYERCPRCGVPMEIARALEWDLDRGIIQNTLTGRREGMIAVQSMNAILRELAEELGEDVRSVLYEAQRGYSRQRLAKIDAGDPRAFWQDYLADMALRGLGYPERFEIDGGSISIEIRNAYSQELFAARLAAGLENVTGQESEIRWDLRERKHGMYTITTRPGSS